MGKSNKKSATKVDVAPVAVTQSGKKGKRGAEKEIEKAVSAKKQKVERDETVVAKQKIEKKLPKKAASSSSSDDSSDDSDSDSDSEPKVVAKKTPVAAVKNGSVVAKKPKEDSSSDSSDSSESDSDDSDEKPAAKKQPTTAVKNGSAPAKKAPASESSSSESDSEDEEPAVVKNVAKKESSSSDSESDSESSDEEEKVAAPVAAAKAKAESSDSDSDEDSSDSDEEPKATQAKATLAKAVAKPTKADSSSSEESSDEDSSEDDEPAKAEPVKKVQAATKSESSSDDESSDDDSDDSDEEETDKQSLKTPKKKDTDVEMVDAEKSAGSTFQKTPKTPATPEATGSKTLFVGNLSFSIVEADVRDFFKDAGEVVDVRFASNAEGQFRGFGHVEFATAEAAQKAMELHDQPLLDRPVRLDLARERDANRSAFTPQNREARGQTAFVRGFDTSQGEDEIRSALQQHFGSCGEITRISIPKDYESGTVKGICYMDFTDSDGFNKALGMDGSDLGGGCYLIVQEAKPRGDSAGGSGGRFDRGGSAGRRGGGRFGGRGGRDGGGRFSGGRGGRDGGRGRGGRGTPYNKPNMTPMGKKTTFDD